MFANPPKFPDNALFITPAQDPFSIEAEKQAETLRETEGKVTVCVCKDGQVCPWLGQGGCQVYFSARRRRKRMHWLSRYCKGEVLDGRKQS